MKRQFKLQMALIWMAGLLLTLPAAAARFTANGNGTVTDSKTGLTWTQGLVCTYCDWTGALWQCENLTLAGFNDWRLPNVKEALSLHDLTRTTESVDPAYFDGTNWETRTSTSSVQFPEQAYYLTPVGAVRVYSKGATMGARCVR